MDGWNKQKETKEIEVYGRIHSDLCNVPKFLLPAVRLQITFTEVKPSFYLMNTKADSTTIFKFLDAKLHVRSIKAHPSILLAHDDNLKTDLACYDLTKVTLIKLTFSVGASSLSIDQGVTGHLPKRLLFAKVDNDFLGAINTNPYRFQDFGIRTYVMFVKGREVPNETLTLDTCHEKMSVMSYKTLFDGSGIHH